MAADSAREGGITNKDQGKYDACGQDFRLCRVVMCVRRMFEWLVSVKEREHDMPNTVSEVNTRLQRTGNMQVRPESCLLWARHATSSWPCRFDPGHPLHTKTAPDLLTRRSGAVSLGSAVAHRMTGNVRFVSRMTWSGDTLGTRDPGLGCAQGPGRVPSSGHRSPRVEAAGSAPEDRCRLPDLVGLLADGGDVPVEAGPGAARNPGDVLEALSKGTGRRAGQVPNVSDISTLNHVFIWL